MVMPNCDRVAHSGVEHLLFLGRLLLWRIFLAIKDGGGRLSAHGVIGFVLLQPQLPPHYSAPQAAAETPRHESPGSCPDLAQIRLGVVGSLVSSESP